MTAYLAWWFAGGLTGMLAGTFVLRQRRALSWRVMIVYLAAAFGCLYGAKLQYRLRFLPVPEAMLVPPGRPPGVRLPHPPRTRRGLPRGHAGVSPGPCARPRDGRRARDGSGRHDADRPRRLHGRGMLHGVDLPAVVVGVLCGARRGRGIRRPWRRACGGPPAAGLFRGAGARAGAALRDAPAPWRATGRPARRGLSPLSTRAARDREPPRRRARPHAFDDQGPAGDAGSRRGGRQRDRGGSPNPRTGPIRTRSRTGASADRGHPARMPLDLVGRGGAGERRHGRRVADDAGALRPGAPDARSRRARARPADRWRAPAARTSRGRRHVPAFESPREGGAALRRDHRRFPGRTLGRLRGGRARLGRRAPRAAGRGPRLLRGGDRLSGRHRTAGGLHGGHASDAGAGRGAEALERFERLAAEPEVPPDLRTAAMVANGYARFWLGDDAGAREAFASVLAEGPSDAARLGDGLAQWRTGDRAGAEETLGALAGGAPDQHATAGMASLDPKALVRGAARAYRHLPLRMPADQVLVLLAPDASGAARVALRRLQGGAEAPGAGPGGQPVPALARPRRSLPRRRVHPRRSPASASPCTGGRRSRARRARSRRGPSSWWRCASWRCGCGCTVPSRHTGVCDDAGTRAAARRRDRASRGGAPGGARGRGHPRRQRVRRGGPLRDGVSRGPRRGVVSPRACLDARGVAGGAAGRRCAGIDLRRDARRCRRAAGAASMGRGQLHGDAHDWRRAPLGGRGGGGHPGRRAHPRRRARGGRRHRAGRRALASPIPDVARRRRRARGGGLGMDRPLPHRAVATTRRVARGGDGRPGSSRRSQRPPRLDRHAPGRRGRRIWKPARQHARPRSTGSRGVDVRTHHLAGPVDPAGHRVTHDRPLSAPSRRGRDCQPARSAGTHAAGVGHPDAGGDPGGAGVPDAGDRHQPLPAGVVGSRGGVCRATRT